jgi:glycerol-3-phosphate dehydrogenase
LLNVFGGKITTYRRLAEEVLEKLSQTLKPHGGPWTQESKLPGGDFSIDQFDAFRNEFLKKYSDLDAELIDRLTRAYGTLAEKILAGAQNMQQLGIHFGANLYEKEVEYLINNEWARSAEDILWRRTKLGLKFMPEEVDKLTQWLQKRLS